MKSNVKNICKAKTKKAFTKTLSKALACLLSAGMVISLAACGQDKGTAEGQTVPDMEENAVYTAQEFLPDGRSADEIQVFGTTGNALYYTVFQVDTAIETYDTETKETETFTLPADGFYPGACEADSEGNLYVLMTGVETTDEGKSTGVQIYRLRKYDAEKNQVWEQELTDLLEECSPENRWINSISVDDEGRCYLLTTEGIGLVDKNGNIRGFIKISNGGTMNTAVTADGKVCLLYCDYTAASATNTLGVIDFDRKEIMNLDKSLPVGCKGIAAAENGLWVFTDSDLYRYDPNSGESSKALTWLDCGMNGSEVSRVYPLANGNFLTVSYESNMDTALRILVKGEVKEGQQEKEEIIVGYLLEDMEMKNIVIAFNQSNEKYHVTLKNYSQDSDWANGYLSYEDAVPRIQALLLTDDCPDILNLTGMNEEDLARQNLVEDLYPYLDESDTLGREDFLDGLLEKFELDGKIYMIPKYFNILTYVGKSSVVGEKMGWTVEDVMACLEKNPQAKLFDGSGQASVLYYCLTMDTGRFLDWEKGECHLDTDEFKSLLEFTKGLDNYDIKTSLESSDILEQMEELQDGKTILESAFLSQIYDIQKDGARFNDAVTFVGYPTADGTPTCLLNSSFRYGIMSRSKHKEGAWEFLQYYLLTKTKGGGGDGITYSNGFPSLKEDFESKVDDAAKQTKDTFQENKVSYAGVWEYTYHIPTQEDVDTVKTLVSCARPYSAGNGQVIGIILEEADSYFQGQKSLEEVIDVMQNRVGIYMSENQ